MPESPSWRIAVELRKVIASAVLFNDRVATKTGMSHGDMQSLHLLQLHGPLTPTQLASLTGLTTGAMTSVIDRLERKGLASRAPHASDRRKIVVSPHNAKIDALLGPYYAEQANHLGQVINSLEATDQATVAGFLSRLNQASGDPKDQAQKTG